MADYYAETYFGILVGKEDFFDTNTRTVDCKRDDCGLNLRPADLFCSVCGKGRSERKSLVTEDTLLPHLEGYEPFSDLDDDYTWNDLLNEYEPVINGLQLRWLRTSSLDNDPAVFLGVQLHRISGEGGWGGDENPSSMSMESLNATMVRVTAKLRDLGFDSGREPHLFTVCYCSV